MSQTELQGQITSQDDSNEDGESFHIEASEAPLGFNAAVPPPPATFADGLQLHVNPRSKSGYTRVESLPDGRFRVLGKILLRRRGAVPRCRDRDPDEGLGALHLDVGRLTAQSFG